MDKIFIGDRVQLDNGKIGVVQEIYHQINEDLLIVKCEDKSLIKVYSNTVSRLQESKPDTITISREEYQKVVSEVIGSISYAKMGDPSVVTVTTLVGVLIGKKIERGLFDKE